MSVPGGREAPALWRDLTCVWGAPAPPAEALGLGTCCSGFPFPELRLCRWTELPIPQSAPCAPCQGLGLLQAQQLFHPRASGQQQAPAWQACPVALWGGERLRGTVPRGERFGGRRGGQQQELRFCGACPACEPGDTHGHLSHSPGPALRCSPEAWHAAGVLCAVTRRALGSLGLRGGRCEGAFLRQDANQAVLSCQPFLRGSQGMC